jgi:hypothetical protein
MLLNPSIYILYLYIKVLAKELKPEVKLTVNLEEKLPTHSMSAKITVNLDGNIITPSLNKYSLKTQLKLPQTTS